MKGEHPIMRRRIEQRLLTRAALARKAGVSRATVVRAENGDRLGVGAGHMLARALGVSYAELQRDIPGQLPELPNGEEAA